MFLYELLFFLKQTGLFIINGLMVIIYMLIEQGFTVGALISLIVFTVFLPRWVGEHEGRLLRSWIFFTGLFLVLVSLFSRFPVPVFAMLIVLSTVLVLALHLDTFHPAQTAWKFVYGATGYALIGIGTPLLENYLARTDLATSYSIQGQNYLGIMAGILLFLFPVGYIALLVKDLFFHKTQIAPTQMIELIRTRGQDRQNDQNSR